MPPKKAPSKKTANKESKRVVEDKTFGLKNKKKSAKVQKYVQTVQKQVDHNMGRPKQAKADKSKDMELEELLTNKPVVQQKKVEKGVDPKSVVCEFFKQGKCVRGNKCKFSHDLDKERKATKIDVYTDAREEDNMDDWDDQKLQDVVEKRHGSNNSNKTDIICKYFLEAVENRKYGWFWVCPNGGNDCKYRHALPPGYVFKKDQKQEEEVVRDIVETIEEERVELKTHTPITLERFLEWKAKKQALKDAANEDKSRQRKADIASGRVMMSGREMFVANPDLFVDDDMAAGSGDINRQPEEIDSSVPVNVITVTGTSITRVSLNKPAGGGETSAAGSTDAAPEPAVDVDSSLFGGDDLDDVDDLDSDEE